MFDKNQNTYFIFNKIKTYIRCLIKSNHIYFMFDKIKTYFIFDKIKTRVFYVR